MISKHFVSFLAFAITGTLSYAVPTVATSPQGVQIEYPDGVALWSRGGTYYANWSVLVDPAAEIPKVDIFLVDTDPTIVVVLGRLVGVVPVTDRQAQITVPTDIKPGEYWLLLGVLDVRYFSDPFTVV